MKAIRKLADPSFIDLISIFPKCHTPAFLCEEMADECWKNHILSTDEFPARLRVPPVRRTLQWKLQDQKLFMLGPVSVHGLCPTHLSGEPERYPLPHK
jgi:hypothetical protein